jgi:hypothetical protein
MPVGTDLDPHLRPSGLVSGGRGYFVPVTISSGGGGGGGGDSSSDGGGGGAVERRS